MRDALRTAGSVWLLQASQIAKCAPQMPSSVLRASATGALGVVHDGASRVEDYREAGLMHAMADVHVLHVHEIPFVKSLDGSEGRAWKGDEHSGDPIHDDGFFRNHVVGVPLAQQCPS